MEFVETLAVPALVIGLVWATVEWVFPVAWSRPAKIGTALALGMACILLLHYAAVAALASAAAGAAEAPEAAAHVTRVTYWGPGPAGYVLAAVMGLLSGSLAPLFHEQVVARWAPKLMKGKR